MMNHFSLILYYVIITTSAYRIIFSFVLLGMAEVKSDSYSNSRKYKSTAFQ